MKKKKNIESLTTKSDKEILYPDINDYLDQITTSKSIDTIDLEDLIYKIHSTVGLSVVQSKMIVRLFFQEIRNLMLRGKIVVLLELGKFFIASPKNSSNKVRIFPKFKMNKKNFTRINRDR